MLGGNYSFGVLFAFLFLFLFLSIEIKCLKLFVKGKNLRHFLFCREERNENQKLLNEEYYREREKAKKEIEERQRQERIEVVRNAIVSICRENLKILR